MKHSKQLALVLLILTVGSVLSTQVAAQDHPLEKPIEYYCPEVSLPVVAEVSLIKTSTNTIGAEIHTLAVSYTESKSLCLTFDEVRERPKVEAITYLSKHARPPQSDRLKDIVKISVHQVGFADYLVAVDTRNYLRGQPLEIIVTIDGHKLRFFWWSSGGISSPFHHNVCMQAGSNTYLFDEEREVWIKVHPKTIEKKKKSFNLVRRIKE